MAPTAGTSASRWIPLLDCVGWDNWGWRRGEPGHRRRRPRPGCTSRRHVHQRLGPEPRGDPALQGPRRRPGSAPAAVQARRQHARPGYGERLAIDPHRNNILYLAAPSGRGLWRSTTSGPPGPGHQRSPTPAPTPRTRTTPAVTPAIAGVLWVTFDPAPAGHGATQTIYVGVADKDNIALPLDRRGVTWARVPGQPTGFLPHKGVLDAVGGYLYLATSDTAGPYDGGHGRRLEAGHGHRRVDRRSARCRPPAATTTLATAD